MAASSGSITVAEAAELCGVTPQAVSQWIGDGVIRGRKSGRNTLVPVADVLRYKAEREVRAERARVRAERRALAGEKAPESREVTEKTKAALDSGGQVR